MYDCMIELRMVRCCVTQYGSVPIFFIIIILQPNKNIHSMLLALMIHIANTHVYIISASNIVQTLNLIPLIESTVLTPLTAFSFFPTVRMGFTDVFGYSVCFHS
jgi:hypothetical protein